MRSDVDPSAHAEMNALRAAARSSGLEGLVGSSVYASGEPCAMCAAAMFWAGVRRVVYGASEAAYRPLMSGGGVAQLGMSSREVLSRAERPVEILGPFLEEEALQPLRAFQKK